MATDPTTIPRTEFPPIGPAPRSGVDATGRLLPASEADRRARLESSARALEAIDRIVDDTDTDERWADVMRGIDEGRPRRKLFEGRY